MIPCYYVGWRFQLTLGWLFSQKRSTKISTSHIPIPFFPTALIYACDYVALRHYFFGAWMSHHLHSQPAPPVLQSAQKPGYRAVVSPTCLPTPLINPAIPLASLSSAWARLPSQITICTKTKKICYNKWGTTRFLYHNVHSGVTRR